MNNKISKVTIKTERSPRKMTQTTIIEYMNDGKSETPSKKAVPKQNLLMSNPSHGLTWPPGDTSCVA